MLFDGGTNETVSERELTLDLPERDSGERQVRRLPLDPEEVRRPAGQRQDDPERQTRPEPAVRQTPPRSREQEVRAPEPESETPRPETDAAEPFDRPLGEASDAETAAESEDPAAGADPAAAPPDSGDGDAAPAEEQAEPTVDPEPAVEEAVPAVSQGGWVVQVAVFSSRETANSIRQRLDELGHRVSMDVLVRDQAELFRLRTGPYEGEAAAERARGQIAATVAGVEPVVRELSGTGAAEERRGMSVQVGSFASRNNAERLVGQLDTAGYDAFMYGEETGGRTIWRVRVGTYETREEAEQLLETLRDERGLEGIVVSHP
jgi:DedD protein